MKALLVKWFCNEVNLNSVFYRYKMLLFNWDFTYYMCLNWIEGLDTIIFDLRLMHQRTHRSKQTRDGAHEPPKNMLQNIFEIENTLKS